MYRTIIFSSFVFTKDCGYTGKYDCYYLCYKNNRYNKTGKFTFTAMHSLANINSTKMITFSKLNLPIIYKHDTLYYTQNKTLKILLNQVVSV